MIEPQQILKEMFYSQMSNQWHHSNESTVRLDSWVWLNVPHDTL